MSLPLMSTDPKPRQLRGGALLGRRIALALYWIGILYVSTVGFASLIPQIFWPQPSSVKSVLKDPAECEPQMSELREQLSAHAKDVLFSEDSQDAFFAAWDQRLWGLRDTCVAHVSHYRDLERLRYKTEIRLAQAASDEGRILKTIRNTHQ